MQLKFGRFDPRLNDPKWLETMLHQEHRSSEYIAKIIGCKTETVNKKISKLRVGSTDHWQGVYTGRFHGLAKKSLIRILKPFIKDIEQTVDEIYDKTAFVNSKIFKDLIQTLVDNDDDTGNSSADILGLPRKDFYILMLKFVVCLYEYDSYYSERIDFVLKNAFERQNEFVIDDQANPEYWYPHRDKNVFVNHIITRTLANKQNIENAKIVRAKGGLNGQ